MGIESAQSVGSTRPESILSPGNHSCQELPTRREVLAASPPSRFRLTVLKTPKSGSLIWLGLFRKVKLPVSIWWAGIAHKPGKEMEESAGSLPLKGCPSKEKISLGYRLLP